MLSLWIDKRVSSSYFVALLSGQLSVGHHLLLVWCSLGLSKNSQGGSYQLELEGVLCRKEKEKDLEVSSNLYFLDSLEEEKSRSF